MDYEIYTVADKDSIRCESCDYLTTTYTTVPYGDDIAEVCIDCYLSLEEDN